jgi:hypothetical protein
MGPPPPGRVDPGNVPVEKNGPDPLPRPFGGKGDQGGGQRPLFVPGKAPLPPVRKDPAGTHGNGTIQNDNHREFPFFPVKSDKGFAEPGAYVPVYGTNIISRFVLPDFIEFYPLAPENRREFPGQKILRQIPGSEVKGGYLSQKLMTFHDKGV